MFDHHSMFDHTWERLSPVDCVFYPSLSVRKDSLPILKGISWILESFIYLFEFHFLSVTPGGRNVYADIIRVYTPSNFFA